jgi:membrane protein YqaA with SNARE-associated domain
VRFKKSILLALQGLLLLGFIAVALYVAIAARESEAIRHFISQYGYGGIFFVALFSGFNLAVPIPAAAFMPLFLESGLAFWPTVILITIGVTVADLIAFFVGHFGRHAVMHTFQIRILSKLETFRERYQWLPFVILFLFAAFAPLPNEILLVPFGFLGYRARSIFFVTLSGNFVFNTLYALGFINIFEIL